MNIHHPIYRLVAALALIISSISIHAAEISLNGDWQIVYDEENAGEWAEWNLAENFPLDSSSVIKVPSSWEEYRKNYEGIAWYRKTFTVPESAKGKSIRLEFDAVNYIAKVFLNGQAIGFHEGGYTPFEFTVDDLLKFGEENVLIVRVTSPVVLFDDLEVDGLVKDEAPHWRGALTAGIWQEVRLKVTERVYTRDAFIEPFIDGRLKLSMDLTCANELGQVVSVEYRVKDKASGTTVWKMNEDRRVETGSNTFEVDAKVDSPKLWSPDEPNLYLLELSINGAERYIVQFGFREIAMKDDGFYLNGEKFYMKSAFWEQLYPITLALPESPDIVRKEIRLAKEAGFNVLRFWRRPPVPYILDLCDEMGIATIGAGAYESMNKKPLPVPEMPSRIFHETERMILRDRNHPSLIMWEIFNELKMPELIRIMQETCLLARELDPTRIIFNESGGWAGPPKAYLPYSREGVTINEDHLYLKGPVNQAIYDDLNHLGHPDYEEKWRIKKGILNDITPNVVTVISEIGYGGLMNLPANLEEFRKRGNPITCTYQAHETLYNTLDAIMEPSGLNEVFASIEELCLASQEIMAQANQQQFEAVRLNPNVHGYCLHAYTGGDYVYGAGILDLWRNPKKAYFTMKDINQPFYVSARVEPRNAYPGDTVKIKVSTVNEKKAREGKVEVSLLDEKGKSIYKKSIKSTAVQGITSIIDEAIKLPKNALGKYELKVAFVKDNQTVAKNSFAMDVFQNPSVSTSDSLIVIDQIGKLSSFLKKNRIPFETQLPAGEDALILTTASNLNNPQDVARFKKVLKRVKAGSTLVLLNPPVIYAREFSVETGEIIPAPTRNKFYTEDILPYKLYSRNAQGRWIPVNHAVSDHPYFDGLPTGSFMDQLYQNVSADRTIIGLDQKPVVSSVSWDHNHVKLAYWSLEGFWWGSDLTVLPHGEGKIVVSTLNLIQKLGTDPVADRILFNIIEHELEEL
ncbi:MAG: sugar-binding domain-containing protein [Puniceicoccaceae bacterium]